MNSIDYFRTNKYRVFKAVPYFDFNLEYEIKWHTLHLKKLKKQKKDPALFHKERGYQNIDKTKISHHQEWVIDSIPFHEKFIKEHIHRLETILSIIPGRIYKKINRISLKYKGTPEYFLYHKKTNTFFQNRQNQFVFNR